MFVLSYYRSKTIITVKSGNSMTKLVSIVTDASSWRMNYRHNTFYSERRSLPKTGTIMTAKKHKMETDKMCAKWENFTKSLINLSSLIFITYAYKIFK